MIQDDREKIFGKIRSGLRGYQKFTFDRSSKSPLKTTLAKNFGTQFEKFKKELAILGGEAVVLNDHSSISQFLLSHIQGSAFIYDETESRFEAVISKIKKSREVKFSSDFENNYDKREVAIFDAAISTCATCIAETGTIVIENRMRLPAALATKLFIIAEPGDLIPSLDELFTDEFRNFKGSNLFLITGPSRTADIEKELVTGVHGPKEVYVIFFQP